MNALQDRVAVVTGGASGIGAAIVARLRQAGSAVVVVDRDPAPHDDSALRADIADDASVRDALATVEARYGRLDILVNNAGVGAQGDVAANPDDEWRRVLDINVIGLARVMRHSLPLLRRSDAASVVNIGSIAATAGLPQRALYTASKGAVVALTRAMAADHLAEGIRVNGVNPGTAATPWVERLLTDAVDPEAALIELQRRQPHGRLVAADEVAEAVAYLVGPASGSTTGTSIAVDGGMQDLRLGVRS